MTSDGAISQMLLFAGAVRPTRLLKASARNVLDLPLPEGQTIGTRWCDAHRELAEGLGTDMPLRVLTDRNTPAPVSMPADRVSIEPDKVSFLGTGGVLRAVAQNLDGRMLVATGGTLLTRPLHELVEKLLGLQADVALLAENDGTPTGLMLVAARAIRDLPGVGYLDLKEQCLPMIAKRHRVRVAVASDGPRVALPVRDRENYLSALGVLSGGKPFQIVEDGAKVSPSARLRDAVVLRDARVGDRAVVARSVLGPKSVVAAGQVLTDRTLGGGS